MNTHNGNLGTSILVPMLMLALMIILMLTLLFASPVQSETPSSPTLDTKAIEQAIGKQGR